jgi:hypothetical protein
MVRASGVLLGLLTALGAQAAEPAAPVRSPPRVWQIPRVLEVVEVPERVQARGTPVAIHALRSGASVQVVAESLLRQFHQAELFVPPAAHLPQVLPGQLQLTALDPDTYIVYTIFLRPDSSGTTTVIISEAFLEERQRTRDPRQAPVMPGAKEVFHSRTEGVSLSHYVVRATEAEVQSFHAALLPEAGYRPAGPGEFRRGAEVLRVTTRQTGHGELAVTVAVLPSIHPEGPSFR